MSRSGYYNDGEPWEMIMWRGAVKSAIRGKRGQALLLELRDALDSMPEKRLIANELIEASGEVCALGRLAQCRQIDVKDLDPEDRETVAGVFNIAPALAAEIVYENDEGRGSGWDPEWTPEKRWAHMRDWVESNIKIVR